MKGKSMLAAVTTAKNTLEIQELPIPSLEAEEALIRVKYTGICGTDTHIYEGSFPLLNYPLIPGHEFVGQLVEVNTKDDRLKQFKPGDWVVGQPFFSCYACETCASGGDNYCNYIRVLGVHANGSMAEYVKIPAKKLIKVNDQSDMKLVSLTEPLSIGVHSITKSELKIGDTAVVIGGGIIGMMTAIAARVAGASKVVVCEVNKFRLDFIRSLGFIAIDTGDPASVEELMDLTDGVGYDKVYEATGTAFGVKLMTQIAKRGGIIVQVGISTQSHPIYIRAFSDKEIQVRGVRLQTFSDYRTALNIIESGREDAAMKRMISNIYPLKSAADAMEFQVHDLSHFKVTVENDAFDS